MARRMATRRNPSSTQDASNTDEFPQLHLDDDNEEDHRVLTQLEENDNFVIDDSNCSCAPQHDNPSTLLPDHEDDYALKECMFSQAQVHQHEQEEFKQSLEEEFDLDFNEHDRKSNNEEPPTSIANATCTQGTLDAVSVLAGGFPVDNLNNNDTSSSNNTTTDAADGNFELPPCDDSDEDDGNNAPQLSRRDFGDDKLEEDDDFMRKLHAYNRKHGIQENSNANTPTISQQRPQQQAVADHSSASTSTSVVEVDNNDLAKQLASSLRKDGIVGLSTEEQCHVDNCKEGKNTKKHTDTQERLEKRWFDTIAEFGGHLRVLATDLKHNPHHTTESDSIDKVFYAVCGGEKSPDKHKIFNDCLVCCGMKWYCLSGANKGKRLQPSAFAKCMEQLTIVFAEKGVKYNFANDFNRKGDFHGVMKTVWKKIRETDPEFGTGANRARTDPALFRKFVQAIRDGNMRPYEDPEHLLICVIFIFGFYLGLRGSSEHLNLMTNQLHIGEYRMEDGQELAGLRWGGVKVPFAKTRQLKLSNTRLTREEDVVLSFVEDPDPVWDPWHVLCFFVDHCHPRATKVFARILKPGGEEFKTLKKAFGKEIWYAEGGKGSNWNMGPTKHRSLCKRIGELSGVDKWESCAGHALRALCITWCLQCGLSNSEVAAKVRHASLNSSKTYAQETSKRKASRMAAMNPSGELTKKRKTSSVKSVVKSIDSKPRTEIVRPTKDVIDIEVSETQPMMPANRSRFEKLTGMSTKKATAAPISMVGESVNEQKENESPKSKLERLEMENKILRLEAENARMKQELACGGPPVPSLQVRSRQSFPPAACRGGYRHGHRDSEFLDYQEHDRDRHFRHSYPPSRRERTPPPHCYGPPSCPEHIGHGDDCDDGSNGSQCGYHGQH